jgi:hypothetical protein
MIIVIIIKLGYRFFPNIQYHYANLLERLNVQILHARRCRHLSVLFK